MVKITTEDIMFLKEANEYIKIVPDDVRLMDIKIKKKLIKVIETTADFILRKLKL